MPCWLSVDFFFQNCTVRSLWFLLVALQSELICLAFGFSFEISPSESNKIGFCRNKNFCMYTEWSIPCHFSSIVFAKHKCLLVFCKSYDYWANWICRVCLYDESLSFDIQSKVTNTTTTFYIQIQMYQRPRLLSGCT